LGKTLETTVKNRDMTFPAYYNSIMGVGQKSMDYGNPIVIESGVLIPCGSMEHVNQRTTDYIYNEYGFKNTNRVNARYLFVVRFN
jgi:hypothetical protein